MDDFQTHLVYGQDGEREVAIKLMENGFCIFPLYQFTDSLAPIVIAIEEMKQKNYTCPDLIAMRSGSVYLFDSKRKRTWVTFTGKKETGLNLSKYIQYKELSDKTGVPCIVVFVHENDEPHGMFATEIHNQNTRLWNGYSQNGYCSKPEMFFTSESLSRIL